MIPVSEAGVCNEHRSRALEPTRNSKRRRFGSLVKRIQCAELSRQLSSTSLIKKESSFDSGDQLQLASYINHLLRGAPVWFLSANPQSASNRRHQQNTDCIYAAKAS